MIECLAVYGLGVRRIVAMIYKLPKRPLGIPLYGVLAGLATMVGAVALGQTAHFSGAQITLPTSTLNNPHGLALDANGNLYIADTFNNRVLKETLRNGTYTESALGTGLSTPQAVAVDTRGNVYIADSGNGRLLKETVSGEGYIQRTISSSVGSPFGLAVDLNGNIFVADSPGSRVLEETVSGSVYTESTIGSNFVYPYSLATDATGNLYVADLGKQPSFSFTYAPAGVIYKETLLGNGFAQSTLISGLNNPYGVAIDDGGNLYVSIYGTPDDPEATQILEETPSSGGYVQSLVGSSAYFFVSPAYMAVDATGTVYLTTIGGIIRVAQSAGDLGAVSVASAGATVSLIFTFDSAGSAEAPQVLTEGIAGLDFFDAKSGTCSHSGTSSYAAGVSCTVDVTLIPLLPGPRHGAVELLSSGGDVIATGYVHGVGVAPQLNFTPGTQSTLALNNATSEYAVTPDSAGNLYIAEAVGANSPQNAVVKESLTVGGYVQSTVATGLAYPVGVAVDGAGNVFIADQDAGQVLKETLQSGGGYTQTIPFSNLGSVESIAVDGAGNVYIGSLSGGLLKETPTAGGYVQSAIAPGVYPFGIAVDEEGNLYLADSSNNQVLKEAVSGSSYTQSLVASGCNGPHAVAVDANGDVYVADTSNGRVVKEVLASGVYSQTTLADHLTDVIGVGVDGSGNVFASSATASTVWKLDFSDAPSLVFPTTTSGATSSAQTVTVANVGNAPLSFPILTTGNNPSISSSFTLGSTGSTDCPMIAANATTPGTLAGGASCQLAISFDPAEAGTLSGTLVLTDNNLNTTNPPGYAVQSLSLSGTALEVPVLTFSSVAPQTYGGASFTVAATSASSGAVTYAVVSGPATISGATVTLTGAGTVVLSADQAGSEMYGEATAMLSFTVAKELPILTFAAVAPQTYGSAPFAVAATSASGEAVSYAVVSGPATISGATVTLIGAGTVVLSANQAESENYSKAEATFSFTVAKALPTLAFAAVAAQTYGNAPFTVAATSASSGAVSYAVVSGPATISGATVTLTGAGMVVLRASQGASANYEQAATTTSFTVAAEMFTLSSGETPASATTSAGGTAAYTLTLAPGAPASFPNAMNLSISGLPTGASAIFAPAVLPRGSGATTIKLTVQTSQAALASARGPSTECALAVFAFGFLLMPFARMKAVRHRLRGMSLLFVVLTVTILSLNAMIGLSGCSGGNVTSTPPAAQTYTFVVTATDSITGIKNSSNLTLIVQ